MNEVTQSTVTEIRQLHERVTVAMRGVLDDAIRIGELLTAMKSELPHGSFETWTRENLPFTTRTARNYMRVFREQDRLKTETVSDLTGAYKALTERRPPETIEEVPFDLADLGCGLALYSMRDEHKQAWVVPSDDADYVFYAWLERDSFDGVAMVGGKKAIRKDRVMLALGDHLRGWPDVEVLPLESGDTWAGPLAFNAMLYRDYAEYRRVGLGIR